jgi:uncharacterized protein (DUF433 family)
VLLFVDEVDFHYGSGVGADGAEGSEVKAKTTFNAGDALRKAPAYPLAEAARYLRLAPATLRSWCVGRPYQRRDGTAHFRPLIQLPERDTTVLSFENLIEAHVLRALRIEHSVSIKDVREAIVYAEKSLHIKRLLTSRELQTHAGELFLDRYGQLISLSRSGQLAMRKLLEAHLKRVDWDLSAVPFRLFPFVQGEGDSAPRNIAIDPTIAFGRPVLLSHGVSTRATIDRIDAGESLEDVAQDYEIEPLSVEEAVLFERAA